MGAKDSKRLCLSYEDAQKRMSEAEYKRVCEAFKRLTSGSTSLLLNRQAFIQNVLGEGVPQKIAEWLYTGCGGGARGIALKDLICGLVLLTRGTQEEKIKFLWTLYCNDSGQQIYRADFQNALQIEGVPAYIHNHVVCSLFGASQERVGFEHFRSWLESNKDSTILSKWLLTTNVNNRHVSLNSDIETPNFYQTLAGVTHLEAQEICELEKCFWNIQALSPSDHLDLNCMRNLVCPPIPLTASEGLFLALDVNRDDHIDFKELCCGISAACRGPIAERLKFCFKMFDMDRDCYLNESELNHMLETLIFIASDCHMEEENIKKSVESIRSHFNVALSLEEFLVWSVEDSNNLMEPLLELLFQVCHVSLGLKPHCRHHEHNIVSGWLEREERRGYRVGQFWYLISSDWWQNWINYTTTPRTSLDTCDCRNGGDLKIIPVEEGIVCDESLISNSTDYTNNSNSMESMGDLLSRGDSCSIASSSGVSSSSGTMNSKLNPNPMPGPIDNTTLVSEPFNCKVDRLTGEGGRLKRDTPLVQHRDFELVPESLWKALALWYNCSVSLPRQVIDPTGSGQVELELYPLNLKILRHQNPQQSVGTSTNAPQSWSSVVGGYGAAALSTAGITTTTNTGNHHHHHQQFQSSPRRYLAYTAAFSRLANVKQMTEFLCARLNLKVEDVRLWHVRDLNTVLLLEDELTTLQDLGVTDADQILLEVRNKDLTWPEELGQLINNNNNNNNERRATICLPPGATGLHNLGNTCFMNAALQAVSNTRPLTLYFQRDGQLCELNSVNPLGTKGVVARRYAELCRELWAGSTRSVAPLKLRVCVTKHAPHLGGGGQHDSQELLAWLLDALHEDLNRVAKKQYTELKDSGGRPDEIVADEAWKQHLNRDHSIITDLFYGQLKSKVMCKTCKHESVRFDPFNLLSLPLPMESYTLCEVLVVRLDGSTPVKYGLRLNSEAKYLELKEQLSKLADIQTERILLADIAFAQIRQILNDESKINPTTATELYAYELPFDNDEDRHHHHHNNHHHFAKQDLEVADSESPLARSPENNNRQKIPFNHVDGISLRKASSLVYQDVPSRFPKYLVAFHRKCVRQENYFLSQQKSKPSLFGLPLLIDSNRNSTCQSLYEGVWSQVTRLLSPLPQSDQTNHATDCDDSLGYEFPFTLKAVLQGGQICAICHWTQFCRGCTIPCAEDSLIDIYKGVYTNILYIAIDWDPTALHLRYQSSREKVFIQDESVVNCRRQHTEPIDLDYCLRAFTSEESLEAKYHCSNCQDKQPATKKLQIWRLPPILIIHLKRFDCVHGKWVKTQKVVNFPFKDFDPTAYLASVPQETILRHKQLAKEEVDIKEESTMTGNNNGDKKVRSRLESTSLLKSPIIDEHLKDYHQHKLVSGEDPLDLKYQLYAVVSHSGMLNGGHYISYACNPNGNWYCYNDSSCREVIADKTSTDPPKIDTSSAYILFYERSGLDYKPYLPDLVSSAGNLAIQNVPTDDFEDTDSDLNKQSCSIQ